MAKDWTGDEEVYEPEFGKRKRKTKLQKVLEVLVRRKRNKGKNAQEKHEDS